MKRRSKVGAAQRIVKERQANHKSFTNKISKRDEIWEARAENNITECSHNHSGSYSASTSRTDMNFLCIFT